MLTTGLLSGWEVLRVTKNFFHIFFSSLFQLFYRTLNGHVVLTTSIDGCPWYDVAVRLVFRLTRVLLYAIIW